MRVNYHPSKKLTNLIVFSLVLICSSYSCSGNEIKNEREKRTIGVLFRGIFDAFQTQRQPAPAVSSFQPQKQSTKADLLSSSKNIFQQKKNILKPPSTQAPDTELITPTVPPVPTTTVPNQPSVFLPEVSPINAEPIPGSVAQNPAASPFSNFIPPPGHHPLSPLKAQVLILPFHGDHSSVSHFENFRLEPQHAGRHPFGYQAEIYLNPPASNMFPSSTHYATRYSPSNGWHDVEEILSRGAHLHESKGTKEMTGSKNDHIEVTTFSSVFQSPETVTKHDEHPSPTVAPVVHHNEQLNHGNYIESHRRDSHYQNHGGEYEHHDTQPLFFPNYDHYAAFNPENLGIYHVAHGGIEPQFHGNHKDLQYSTESEYNKNFNELTIPHAENYDSHGSQQNSNSETKHIKGQPGNSHDYVAQREYNGQHAQNSYTPSYHPIGHHTNQIHNGEIGYQDPYHEEKSHQYDYDNKNYPTKVGKVPGSLIEYQYHHNLGYEPQEDYHHHSEYASPNNVAKNDSHSCEYCK